jgi:hypothetical protein
MMPCLCSILTSIIATLYALFPGLCVPSEEEVRRLWIWEFDSNPLNLVNRAPRMRRVIRTGPFFQHCHVQAECSIARLLAFVFRYAWNSRVLMVLQVIFSGGFTSAQDFVFCLLTFVSDDIMDLIPAIIAIAYMACCFTVWMWRSTCG